MIKKIIISILLFTVVFNSFSKNSQEVSSNDNFIISETSENIVYMDSFGNETNISKNPKRVVVCYNSILGLWYFTGGTSLTKVKGSTNVPEEAKGLFDLGTANSVSLEAIIALEPDLVILAANYDMHVAMVPMLKEIGTEVMLVDTSINAYDRFQDNALLFSKINGTEGQYDNKVLPIIDSVNKIIEKSKSSTKKPKVAAIFATRKSLKLESDIALTGEVVNLLGGENILNNKDILAQRQSRVEFSIEAIITQNPEIIFISTMGNVDSVKKNMEKMIKENPVWNEVDAVKNGSVYYLPKQFSVYKPNQLYGEAFMFIAKLMYPEVFGE